MARLFDTYHRIVPTWLEAARYLNTEPGCKAMNLVLEFSDPLAITPEDRQVMDRVDIALAHSGLTLNTVAGTIFPLDLYRRYGRPEFYKRYKAMLKRGKKARTWGTYADRMISRPGRRNGEEINPLELLVYRLSDEGRHGTNFYHSAYELGISDPEQDLPWNIDRDMGGDVPTYNVATDGRRWYGSPCLSHLSFKRVVRDEGHVVNLTAVYRSHHYCQRALGNLLGLSQLLWFVSKEAGLGVGTLTCLSSHAELDVEAWGGANATRELLANRS